MAAGLGYKEFSTGDVLTAADANGYLASQVVMVFASAAARTSAIASPQEGMISYLKDTNSTEYYSGSAWVAIGGGAAGGKVLQVVSTAKTDTFTTTSTSLVDLTGLSVTITPSSATSTILVMFSVQYSLEHGNGQQYFQLLRGSTAIAQGDAASNRTRTTAQGAPVAGYTMTNYALQFIDSPATTSATTYKIQTRITGSTGCVNRTFTDTDSSVYPRGISTITVMEIGA